MLVRGVRTRTLCPESVENRDAERSDQVAVRAASRRLLFEVQAELAAVIRAWIRTGRPWRPASPNR